MLPLRICWQLEVCDDNNCAFLLKLLATIGANVPPTSSPEESLVRVAQRHALLGETATFKDIEAWASREANLHRGFMQYLVRRSNRNPDIHRTVGDCAIVVEPWSPDPIS
ncbi:unnamed protein product [Durusdinium trenchii]|uniref:Uncharacterized protein n=1 Tax=Durusdinium trenchii TaxID=1381693 RepID=A0ABP0SNX2_9DINO